jgi:hypothetical protein
MRVRKQCWKWFEPVATMVKLQSYNNHAPTCSDKREAYRRKLRAKEMRFINANYLRVADRGKNVGCGCRGYGAGTTARVRDQFLIGVARVFCWLDGKRDFLRGARGVKAANEFRGFTGEHGTADQFKSACG